MLRFFVRGVWIGVAATLALGGCYPGSDAQVAARQDRIERQRRLEGMKAATRSTPAGAALGGEALAAALSGKTHVFVYQSQPSGAKGRYVEWYHFEAGGHLAYTNSLWALDPAGRAEDRWRIDGDRLCYVNTYMTPDEQCFRLARDASGRLQYSIVRPGTPYDGLLTKVTDAILDGPPPSAAHAPAG